MRAHVLGLLLACVLGCGAPKRPMLPADAFGDAQVPENQEVASASPSPSAVSGPTGPSALVSSFFLAIKKGPFAMAFVGSSGESGPFAPLSSPVTDSADTVVYEIKNPPARLRFVVGCSVGTVSTGTWLEVAASSGEAEVSCETEATLAPPARSVRFSVDPGNTRGTQLGVITTHDMLFAGCSGLCAAPTVLDVGVGALVFDALVVSDVGARRSFAVLRNQDGDAVSANADAALASTKTQVVVSTDGRLSNPTGALELRFASALGVFSSPISTLVPTSTTATSVTFDDVQSVPQAALADGDEHRLHVDVTGSGTAKWAIASTLRGAMPAQLSFSLTEVPSASASALAVGAGYLTQVSAIPRGLTRVRSEEFVRGTKGVPDRRTTWTWLLDPAATGDAASADLSSVPSLPGFGASFTFSRDGLPARVEQTRTRNDGAGDYSVTASDQL